MDTMRGNYGSLAENDGYDPADDETARQAPPPAIGQDERRMQVRAYNHWASLLEDRNFPPIEDLEPDNLPDFGPYSVLLDFGAGIENPGISYLGEELAIECDVAGEELRTLSDVPPRSLLSRITDHYMQILANQAPIGFEAEFVNQRGATIAYRGILLPFSSDDDTIDFIYGVINWKELADVQAADELLLEIDQVLEPKLAPVREDEPLTDWADGPGALPANDIADPFEDTSAEEVAADAFETALPPSVADENGLPVPSFGLGEYDDEGEDEDDAEDAFSYGAEDEEEDEDEAAYGLEDDAGEETGGSGFGSLLKMPIQLPEGSGKTPIELGDAVPDPDFDEEEPYELSGYGEPAPEEEPVEFAGPALEEDAFELAAYTEPTEIELPEIDPADMGLGDWLAAAREMAAAANSSEDRTRTALYEAIGRAYDFSLAAAAEPAEFDDLLTDAGLTMQDRAPMTPVVKLVFGADYDKTRLTEYAAALTPAHRLELPLGALGDFLREADGGLKGVVKAERRLRREESGKTVEPIDAPRHALAKKLRALEPQAFEEIDVEGAEFALVMIRRTDEGEVIMLGEVPEDVALVERAARRLLG